MDRYTPRTMFDVGQMPSGAISASKSLLLRDLLLHMPGCCARSRSVNTVLDVARPKALRLDA